MSDKKSRTDATPGERVTPPPTMKSALATDEPVVADKPEEVAVVTKPSASLNAAPSSPTSPKRERSLPTPPPPRAHIPSRPTLPKPTNLPVETKRTPTFSGASKSRTPTLTGQDKPKEAKEKDEYDLHSLFDVDSHPVEIEVDAVVEDDAEAKRKAMRASRPDRSEVSRSRKIVDEDLFNMSAGLFGGPAMAPLVAPDMSALAMPGLSKDPTTKTADADKAKGEKTSAAPVEPLFLIPTSKAPETPVKNTPNALEIDIDMPAAKPGMDKKRVGIGVVIVALVAAGAFFFAQSGASKKDDSSSALATGETTAGEAREGTTPADRAAALGLETGKSPDPQAAAAVAAPSPNPATDTAGGTKAVAASPDKHADATPRGDAKDKPQGTDKAPDKPPVEAAPTPTTNKSQSLAEAMAAANAGGGTKAAPPPPPAGGGGDFSTSAASSALGAAAGRASGCKKDGDPSGVARVSVTFAPSGRATRATVNGPPFAGTQTGGCIAAAFRSASVPAFSGDPVTVSKSVTIR